MRPWKAAWRPHYLPSFKRGWQRRTWLENDCLYSAASVIHRDELLVASPAQGLTLPTTHTLLPPSIPPSLSAMCLCAHPPGLLCRHLTVTRGTAPSNHHRKCRRNPHWRDASTPTQYKVIWFTSRIARLCWTSNTSRWSGNFLVGDYASTFNPLCVGCMFNAESIKQTFNPDTNCLLLQRDRWSSQFEHYLNVINQNAASLLLYV